MSIEMITAYGKNRELGVGNAMPWKIADMSADMAHFRHTTIGGNVIMGRKTFESIGSALGHRRNIVLSRKPFTVPGVETVHSIPDALDLVSASTVPTFVIGGGAVYAAMLEHATHVYATEVNASFPEADIFFPELPDENWKKVASEEHAADAKNKFSYAFTIYERA